MIRDFESGQFEFGTYIRYPTKLKLAHLNIYFTTVSLFEKINAIIAESVISFLKKAQGLIRN